MTHEEFSPAHLMDEAEKWRAKPEPVTTAGLDGEYLATSPKTGEVWTRGGRVLVGTKAEWEGMRVGMLIPAPHRPFGAVELIDRPEEVTVDEIAAIIKAKREELIGLSHKGYTDYRMAEAVHARLYGPSPRMGEPPAP